MKNLNKLLKAKNPKVGDTLFIAIDGHGGSGKSTFGQYLGEQLGAEVIHTDDFASWNNSLNLWPDLINNIFTPIKNGDLTLNYQPASWWENHHPEPIVNQGVTPIMILEGVGSTRREFSDYISFRIFVDTPKEICLQRGLEKDAGTGKSIDELKAIWKEWFAEEDEYFNRDNPKSKADIIIDGTKPFEEQIEF